MSVVTETSFLGDNIIKSILQTTTNAQSAAAPAASLCAGHVQQLRGESPLPNLMEVKG
jgi:hypothetical protein